jgi:glucokinase
LTVSSRKSSILESQPQTVNPQVIGVDLGGTAIKLGRFNAEGDCLAFERYPTPQPAAPEAVLKTLVGAVRSLQTSHCLAIGLGCPGPADAQGRVAQLAINLPGWLQIPLADWLEAELGLPVYLENDGNCAGLGEAWLGAGRDYQDFLLLTLGTGVGGAVFLGGELFRGRLGAGGELGLLTMEYEGPRCNSGNRGSLEQQVSAQAIWRRTGKTGADWAALATANDPTALAFWADYGRRLGAGIANLIYVLTPEAVLLGGGLSAAEPYFRTALAAEIQQRVLPPSREGLVIQAAQLGNRAGMVGAARLAWRRLAGC